MSFAETVSAWAERKAARRALTIREPRTVDVTHKRALGARGEYARVVVVAKPSEEFSFVSRVQWPAAGSYDTAVLDGLLDEMLATSLGPHYSRISFELQEIGWHDVDSCAAAFYSAGRAVVREVVGPMLKSVAMDELWAR